MLSAKELEVRLWYRNRRKKTDQVHNNHEKHESGSKCCDSTQVGHARLLGPTSSSNGGPAVPRRSNCLAMSGTWIFPCRPRTTACGPSVTTFPRTRPDSGNRWR